MSNRGWIGVDLDGTLAEYHGWQDSGRIGPPIPKMAARVKAWLEEGKEVRIFTARAAVPEAGIHAAIEAWCVEHIGVALPVVCQKDYAMIELWDDRARRVEFNTGREYDAFSADPGLIGMTCDVCGKVVDWVTHETLASIEWCRCSAHPKD